MTQKTNAKNFKNMTYYEARIKVHEDFHQALNQLTGAHVSLTAKLVESALTGVQIASAIGIVVFLFGQNTNVGILIPLLIISSILSYASFRNDTRALADAVETISALVQIVVYLPSLYGAPHDRIRDDKEAMLYLAQVRKAIRFVPPQKYRFRNVVMKTSAVLLTAFLIQLLAFNTTMGVGLLVVIIWAVVFFISLSCYVPAARELEKQIQETSDIGAFSLAEYGLRLDGKF